MERSGVPEAVGSFLGRLHYNRQRDLVEDDSERRVIPGGICPEANASTSNRSVNSLLWLTFAPMTAL